MTGFGERLARAVDARGPVCVGIDPHAALLETWGLGDDPASLERFGRDVVAAAADRVGVVKPQVAFFERHAARGYLALERVLADARDAGLVVIADAKRGDVGTSVTAYAEAWLTPGSPLEADAMTLSAFQGVGSIDEPIRIAERHGKGVFVLCATSNPEAVSIQRSALDGSSVAARIEREVRDRNARAQHGVGSIGLVVGATIDAALYGVGMDSNAPILAPGFGHQGARLCDLDALFPPRADRPVLAAVSRSVLSAGPQGIAGAIDAAMAEAR